MLREGEVVGGRFVVERLAGSGGMGAVYRALDRDGGEVVALKILHGQEARAAERFTNEAELLSRLAHPRVVRYVDHGETPAGLPFLVMEWLEGEDLAARLARAGGAGLSVAESLALGRAIASGLQAAHAQGIVHRDLKPSNVMLVGGSLDRVKIVDFGIARGAAARSLTQTGAVVGTPGYMAPEQVRSARHADARADVFALGALLFECLTGRPAFSGDHALAILAKLLLEEAPRPREIVPSIPVALDALVSRMLAKDPGDRPADAAVVAGELSVIEAALPAAEDLEAGRGGPAATRSVSPGPVALTGSEQRLLCVILAAPGAASGDPDAPTVAVEDAGRHEHELGQTLAHHGARAEWLSGGAVLVTVEGGGSATDQAARAAHSALALRRRFPDLPIALVTGRSEANGKLPVGVVLDRAAALLSPTTGSPVAGVRSSPGVLLDDLTRALLDVRFDVAEGPRGAELLDERAIGDETRTLLGKPSPCVGRDRELRALGDLLEQCVEESVARVALITAPAGTGKSRVRSELLRRVAQQHPEVEIWAGRGDPMSTGSAFGLVGSALRRAAGILGGEPVEERRRKLSARVAERVPESERARVAALLGEVAGCPFPDDASPRLYAARRSAGVMADQVRLAFQDLMAAECAAHPVLLVLEDLQWGDLPSVKLVDLALRENAGRPLAVVALGRPEVHDLFPRLWAERDLAEIRLGDLTRRAAESLVRHALGPAVAAETVTALVDRAAGNAFYLEELIRAVAEGATARAAALPETVLAMVEARLLALPPEARRVLRAGSVFGEVFWGGAVTTLLGGGSTTVAEAPGEETRHPGDATLSATRDLLGALCDRELLTLREASTFPGEVEYAFRHGLLREGAYAMLSPADRALGHRLAAAWLERAGEGDPMVLAEHHERGGEPARAVPFFRRAAQQALAGDDHVAAIARATRGLACGAAGDDELALMMVRGEATSWSGDLDAAEARAAEVIARAPAGSYAWYWVLAGRVVAHVYRGRIEAMVSDLMLAISVEPLPGGAPGLVALLGAVAAIAYIGGHHALGDTLQARMEQAAASLDPGDLRSQGWLESGRAARALHMDGDAWASLALTRRAAALFEEAGDRQYVMLQREHEAEIYLLLGATAQAAEAHQKATAPGNAAPFRTALSVHIRAELALLQRTPDEALAEISRLAADPVVRSMPVLGATLASLLSIAHLRRGDLAASEDAARAALADPIAKPPDRSTALGTLAELRLAQGRPDEALAFAREGLRASRPRLHDHGCSRLLLAEILALSASGSDTGAAVEAACERILAGASKIEDPDLRRAFLEDAPQARTLALGARRATNRG